MDLCTEKILSEEYQDYLISDSSTRTKQFLRGEDLCSQEIGYGYETIYIAERINGSVSLDRADYHSIPQCYGLLDLEALQETGILQLQRYPTLELMGENVLLGFIDTGIDITSSIFRNLDGTTRIETIWDQTIQTGNPPEGIRYGREYSREEIDEILRNQEAENEAGEREAEEPGSIEESGEVAESQASRELPAQDTDGHGTRIASVACANGSLGNEFLGAAPESSLAVVKLKPAKQYLRDYFFIRGDAVAYQENDIMLAAVYLHRYARSRNLPLVLCLALGNNLGSHEGSSPLPYILGEIGKTASRAIVLGTGNEAGARHHYLGLGERNGSGNGIGGGVGSGVGGGVGSGTGSGKIERVETVELFVGNEVKGFTLEMWSEIPQLYTLQLQSPSGETIPRTSIRSNGSSRYEFFLERATVWVDYRILVERTQAELIHLRIQEPSSGIWKILVEPVGELTGNFHMWMTGSTFLTGEGYFLRSNPYTTIMEPGNLKEAITTAWLGRTNTIAIQSGRGYTRTRESKPDIATPGTDISAVSPDDRTTVVSGSSVATGITAGGVALLMEWLVYNYGEAGINSLQIKNFLILGAERNPQNVYPNREEGFGELDLFRTFDTIRQY